MRDLDAGHVRGCSKPRTARACGRGRLNMFNADHRPMPRMVIERRLRFQVKPARHSAKLTKYRDPRVAFLRRRRQTTPGNPSAECDLRAGELLPHDSAGTAWAIKVGKRSAPGLLLVCLLPVCAGVARAQEPGNATATVEDLAQRPEVADLDLQGVMAIAESELRAALETEESPWLPWRDRKYFNPEVFQEDLERIVMFYAERGYPHARVVESAVDRRDGKVALRIVVDEGQPVRVADVRFTGIDVIAPSRIRALSEAAPLKRGDPLAAADAQATAQMVANLLGDAGFAYARVEVRETPVGPDRARVEFRASPGSRATFGPIQITGNVNISDDVIRRELAYFPGQPFRASALRESQRRLVLLGLFEQVLVEIAEPDQPMGEVPTRVTVKEADLNQFGYSFGYGTEEQLNVEASWRHLNAFGGGRTTTIRGRWSSIDRGGEGLFRYPYLFTSKLSLQLSGYAWQWDEPVFTMWSRGGSSSLTYQLGAANWSTATYLHQFESSRLDDVDSGSTLLTALGVDPADGTQEGVLAALQLDGNRDTTVDPLNPRRGYRLFARMEKAGGWLPGSFTYHSLFVMGRYYYGIGPTTLAGRVQIGTIVPGSDADLPFSKRHFLGGADSLRGWGRLEVSPLSPLGSPVGGRSVLALNGELRFPIVGPLSGVAFIDAGNVWSNTWQFHIGDLRSDTGGGVRVNSPFGLLRLDLGYQLTPFGGVRIDGEPAGRRWRVHGSIGHTF